ncbi:MAG TPA: hypothetical protein VD999_00610 [Vitreimonas sp.]|nr:hypothetical protein [Vitreimonas sp.]
MAYTINFLRNRQKELSKLDQQDRRFFKIAMVVFGVITILSIIATSSQLFLTYRVKQLKDKQNELKRQVVSQENVERSYVIFANKIKILGELFQQRSDKRTAINYFSSLFGPQVLISEISFEGDESLLQFGLKAQDVFTLEEVFEKLSSDEVKNQYAAVNKSELARNQDGGYSMQVTISLNKTEKK